MDWACADATDMSELRCFLFTEVAGIITEIGSENMTILLFLCVSDETLIMGLSIEGT